MTEKDKPTASTHGNTISASPDQRGEQRRARFLEQFALVAGILLFINTAGDVLLYFDVRVWQLSADLALSSMPTLVTLTIIYYLARRQKIRAAAYGLLLIAIIFFPLSLLFLGGREWLVVVAAFVFFMVAVIVIWPGKRVTWVAASALYLAYSFGIMQLNPVERYDITQTTTWIDLVTFAGILLTLFVLWLVVRISYGGTIRARLLIAFIALTSLPLIVVVAYLSFIWSQDLQERTIDQLESIATLKEVEVEMWIDNLQNELTTSLIGEDAAQIKVLLQDASGSIAYKEGLRERFQQITELGRLEEIFLIDLHGRVILSTDPTQENESYAQQPYFQQEFEQTFVQYSLSLKKTLIAVIHPVKDKGGQTIAVLIGLPNLQPLNEIMLEQSGLGDSGETYLVDSNHTLLTDSRFPDYSVGNKINTQGINTVVDDQQNGAGIYGDYYNGEPIIGAYRWLPKLKVGLMSELDLAEARRATNVTLIITVGVVLLFILIAVGVAFWVTHSIANPLTDLAQTAAQIAGGNLELTVNVEREDEIGTVALAFNSMTVQLRDLVSSLEQRVAGRTQRLKIVATLSERLSAILDVDQLLTEMVNQVKESFDYYHAHVYIIDDSRQNLVMTAGFGEVGQRMKTSGHSIPLDAPTSFVARAVRTGKIVRVDNVREAEDWLPNPLLPDTYSEMAVPIILEGQVVGVLDVQEDKIAGLDEGDASLLRSLANQVAVTIRNARLFAEVETALAEARIVQEQYVEQAWSTGKAVEQGVEYQHQRPGVGALHEMVVTHLEQEAMRQSQPVIVAVNGRSSEQAETKGSDGAGEQREPDSTIPEVQNLQSKTQNAVVAPIKLQNQTIGAIQLHETERDHHWSELELSLVQAVADQVAQVSESLRLFDETRQQAGFERTAAELTQRIRQAPNIAALAQIAADELGRVLEASHSLVTIGANPNKIKAKLFDEVEKG